MTAPAARCSQCGHPLTAARSVRLELGPVCAARRRYADAVRTAALADLDAVAAIVAAAPVPVLAAVRAALADLADALGIPDALDGPDDHTDPPTHPTDEAGTP